MLLIQEIRDIGFLKYLRSNTFVFFQISRDHGNLPIFQILFPHQLADPSRRLFHLLHRRFCCKHADLVLRILISGSSVSEQMLFQKVQRRGRRKTAFFSIF